MSEIYDVVIVGAGPAGSATAHYLAREGLNVLLLDKFNFPRDKTCGDALTPRALHILDDMGILNDVQQVGHRLVKLEVIAPKGHPAVPTLPKKDHRDHFLSFLPPLLLANTIPAPALPHQPSSQI